MTHQDVLLYSGGLDSYIAYHFVQKELGKSKPKTLYCNLGHRYREWERMAVLDTVPDTLETVSVQLGNYEESNANIPYRNAFLLLQAALHFPPDTKYLTVYRLVCQEGEMDLPDRTLQFFHKMTTLIVSLSPKGSQLVCSPTFSQMTKTEMVKWYLNKGLDAGMLKYTRSCYSQFQRCGKCSACFRRWVAFTLNGLQEDHATPFDADNPAVLSYRIRMAGLSKEQRKEKRWIETTEALKMIGVIV